MEFGEWQLALRLLTLVVLPCIQCNKVKTNSFNLTFKIKAIGNLLAIFSKQQTTLPEICGNGNYSSP